MIPTVEKCLEVSHRKGLERNSELQEKDFKSQMGLAIKAHVKRLNFASDEYDHKGHKHFSCIYSGKTLTPLLANQTSGQCKSTLQRGVTSHASEESCSKSVKTRNAGQDVEKREPCYANEGNVNFQWLLWSSVLCFLKHLKNRAT